MDEVGAFDFKNPEGSLRREEQVKARAAVDRIRKRAKRPHTKRREGFDWPTLKKLRDQDRP
jgi:hypothetical protein